MTRRLVLVSLALALAAAASFGCAVVFTQQARLEIETQVRNQQPAFITCYEAALKKDREMRGTVTLAFTVMPDGMVQNVRLTQSEVTDEELKQCVITKAQGIRVSHLTARPVEVTFPLRFSQSDVPF